MRTQIHTTETAPEAARDTLKALTEQMGGHTLNIFGAMAESPAVLNGYASLERTLRDDSSLGEKVRQAIHLRVSVLSECDYCSAAYTGAARGAGWSAEEASAIAAGDVAFDQELSQLLTFVEEIVERSGWVSDETWEASLAAGWSEQALLDAFAEVPRTLFTNWFNHLAGTPLDEMFQR